MYHLENYQKDQETVLSELQTSPEGLQESEVKKRQERDGLNELKQKEKDSVLKLFLATFKDAMVIVLLIVAVIQMALGSVVESLIIFAVLMINSIISVIQTKKAESSLDALSSLSAPESKVIRNGVKVTIPAKELVVGDIVLLDAGDYVPADGRLLEAGSLQINEGMLTGESVPADKSIDVVEKEVPVGDRSNMVHSGTLVTYGRGLVVVTGTGNNTEIGQVASLIDNAVAKQTPLQRKLDDFSKKLGFGILILSVLIFAIQAARIFFGGATDVNTELLNAFMFAVAVAVAAIPEALQSIVTIVLSTGTGKMAKKHAIIRKLPAVETLGSTSVICTDKTGTLTQNKMTIVDYFLPNGQTGDFNAKPETWSADEARLMQIAVLANDSNINEQGQELGDPTEVAMIAFSNKVNKPYHELRNAYPRLAELPFDSDRKLMSTVHTIDGEQLMLTKGGPDVVFNRSSKILLDGQVVPLTDENLKALADQNEAFSDRALRVLAFAYKPITEGQTITFEDENDLILVGLVAMIDPPREAVYGAVEQAKKAGIKTVMITGDHKTTARAIARDIGISEPDDIALTGQELDALSEDELNAK